MDQRWHFSCTPDQNRMDKRIWPVSGRPLNDRHLHNLETAKPIWRQPCTGRKRRPAPKSNERKGRFSENHSQTCNSPTWTRTSGCLHSKGSKREPKTMQWNTASRPWVAQPQLENPPGRRPSSYEDFFSSQISRTDVRRGVLSSPPVACTTYRRTSFLVFRTWQIIERTCVGSRPNGLANPFPSCCTTPLPTQTSLPHTGIKMNFSATPRGGMLFGRLVEQSPRTRSSWINENAFGKDST